MYKEVTAMWKMRTIVDKNLYDEGYWLEGEGNRVDIVGPEGKCFEIFFFGEDILIMCEKNAGGKTLSIKYILVMMMENQLSIVLNTTDLYKRGRGSSLPQF